MSTNFKKRRSSKSPSKNDEDGKPSSVSKKTKLIVESESTKDTDASSPVSKDDKGENPPSIVPKVVFKSIKSPSKKGSYPLLIRFLFVNDKLVCFYFDREKYGNNKTYANHLLRQAILKEVDWLSDFNLSADEFFLHVDGVPQKHYPGAKYNKRLFLLDGLYVFDNFEGLVAFVRPLATIIVEELNKRLNKDSRVTLPSSDDELIKVMDDSVFADVAGDNAACEKLIDVLGEDYTPDEFNEHSSTIYSFFKPGNIPNHIGKLLGCSASDMKEEAIYE